VRCDPRLLVQALVNLLLNACDASPRNSPVDVTASATPDGLELVVADEGPGISEAIASRIAEPFVTTKPVGKGTGLGLAIASEIARIHRGELRLEPASPHGTRACLRIPRADGEPHA